MFNNATNDYVVLAFCAVNGYELRLFRYWEFVSFLSYRVLILSDNYLLSLPAATPPRAWAFERVGRLKADSHIACRAHAVPLPCRAVNSHMPCRAPALLRQCRVLRESLRGKRKYLNYE